MVVELHQDSDIASRQESLKMSVNTHHHLFLCSGLSQTRRRLSSSWTLRQSLSHQSGPLPPTPSLPPRPPLDPAESSRGACCCTQIRRTFEPMQYFSSVLSREGRVCVCVGGGNRDFIHILLMKLEWLICAPPARYMDSGGFTQIYGLQSGCGGG